MRFRYQSRDKIYDITVERHGEGYRAIVDGQPFELEVLSEQPGQISLLFAGQPVTLYWAGDNNRKWISLEGCTYLLERPAPRSSRRVGETGGGEQLRAPMPAQVRSLLVAVGDRVEQGQTLALLEAMKMEIRLKAARAGTVVRLAVRPGEAVDRDQVVLEIQ